MAPLRDEQALRVLRRLLSTGPLDRLPKRRADQNVVFALASALFLAGRLYREDEVNEYLQRWLVGFAAPMVDHVSLRRALVDHRYLLRDQAGFAYRCNPAKTAAQLTPTATSIDPGAVLADLTIAREQRKRGRAR